MQGAKNHGVILPDANKENTLNQVRFISPKQWSLPSIVLDGTER